MGFEGTIVRGGGRHGHADEDAAAATVEDEDEVAAEVDGLDKGHK